MGLIDRRKRVAHTETWPNREAAAEERFQDALLLSLSGGREGGAIYLFGYVAEILLKTAYSRYAGKGSGELPFDFLKADMAQGSMGATRSGRVDLHSLAGLCEFLIDARAAQSQRMASSTEGLLRSHIAVIESHWNVRMRYSAFPATVGEMRDTYQSTSWIRTNYDDLWS